MPGMLDLVDILYEGRNKDYGSYDLRKKYNRNVLIGLIGSLVIVLSIVYTLYFQFLIQQVSENNPPIITNVEFIDLSTLPFPEAHNKPLVEKAMKSVSETPPEISNSKTDEIPKPEDTQNKSDTVKKDLVGENADTIQENDTILGIADVEYIPQFIGGENEFRRYLARNFVWPKLSEKVQGKVTVEFQITKTGSVRNVKILNGMKPIVDTEVIRLFSSCPEWKPAMRRGRAVDITFCVSIYLKNF
jgi:periplasmic protein TonB